MEPMTDDAPAAAGPDLSHLLAQAESLDGVASPGTAPGAAPAVAPAPALNTAAELAGALTLVRMMAAPMFTWWPEFERTWSDQTIEGIAQGGAAVMDRHGWSMSDAMTQWGPYIALIGAVAPPSFVTYQAIKHRKEARDERQEQARD